MEASEVVTKLGLEDNDIINIYAYGSRVYGTATSESDSDFIIIYKSAMLPNGAFRNNAISSEDRSVQGVCYSRSGFQDALNNYEIGALECLSVPHDLILRKNWPFQIYKWDNKVLARKIIEKASASWHNSKMRLNDDDLETSKKSMWHALRILMFGLQLKKHQRIIDFSQANNIRSMIYQDKSFHIKKWISYRTQLIEELRQ